MKCHHLAEVSKSWESAFRSNHAGRAWWSPPDKCLIYPDRRQTMDDIWTNAVENMGTGSRLRRLKRQQRPFRG
jgi:hypothetical protein